MNPLAEKDGMPGYAVQWMEVDGPLADESTGAGYRLLFGDLPMKRVDAGQPGVVRSMWLPQRNGRLRRSRSGWSAGTWRRSRPGRPRWRSSGSSHGRGCFQQSAGRRRAFAACLYERAYRRPVEEAHVQRMFALFNDQFDKNFGFAKSLLSTYTAVLSSPAFIFVQEQPGRLDDYALATRLALFLWNSEPDAKLRNWRQTANCTSRTCCAAQAERLLDDPKARAVLSKRSPIIGSISAKWTTLPHPPRFITIMNLTIPLSKQPCRKLACLLRSCCERIFPRENLVDSDFTFLNERLATHYGISGVTGAKMRRVALPEGCVRGGLMTQASILKITANGTTTSPVLRGHWITERILG